MSRWRLRELRTPDEYRQAQEVARRAWHWSDLQVPSVPDLMVARHVGGLTAGAFEGRALAGFVHGFPRTDLDHPCHHSHMLAVVPTAQGRGLASRLKFFQRRWCLARGVRQMSWTYDPLLVRNAALNLNRLRARASLYHRDFYGPLSGIYQGLPTDRFEVFWRLDAREVAAAARRGRGLQVRAQALPRAHPRQIPRARRLAVEIPRDARGLYAADPTGARRARLRLREVARRLFAGGYAAVAIEVLPGRALYVFER